MDLQSSRAVAKYEGEIHTRHSKRSDLWARGRGCAGRKEPGESSVLAGLEPGVAGSAPPAHPVDKPGQEGFAPVSLQD